jgi:hypothetical protein
MGNSIDDALALALLYGLQGKNETRVLSVSVTKPNLKSAAFCDAVMRFYLGPPGPFGGGDPPVGMALTGKMPEDTPMVAQPLSRQTPEGKPVYARGIQKLNDTADPVALIRNALTSQYDQNAMVVLTGPATNLANLLDLPGAKAVISQKVRYLTAAVGSFAGGRPESAITCDIAAAKKLVAEWPTPIVFSGAEVGEGLPFPGASIEKDFAWSQAHPVVDAYRAYKPMPYDAPSGAMTAVLYAIRPKEGYFKLSEPGTVTVLDDGRTRFTPSAEGKHRYLIADPSQKDRIIQTYTEIASMKPAGRPQRFRLPQKKEAGPPKTPAK